MKKRLIICSITSSIVMGCHVNSTYDNREKDKQAAEQITNKFYQLLKEQDYEGTCKLFSKRFFTVSDTSVLNDIYKTTIKENGLIDSCFIENWETHDIRGTDSKTDYGFVYIVKRKNKDTKESIALSKEKDGVIRIVGYHVNWQP